MSDEPKINYRIHTDAIKSHLIPEEVTREQANIIYAEEADVLNVARLLKTTNEPISLIGELSGIPSRTTLSRLFRNAYGMTCREYRQVAQQK